MCALEQHGLKEAAAALEMSDSCVRETHYILMYDDAAVSLTSVQHSSRYTNNGGYKASDEQRRKSRDTFAESTSFRVTSSAGYYHLYALLC